MSRPLSRPLSRPRSCLCLLALATMVSAADPQPAPLCEVSIPDGGRLLDHWRSGPIARTWADPGVAALRQRLDQELAKLGAEAGYDVFAVLAASRNLRLELSAIDHPAGKDEAFRIRGQMELNEGAEALFAAIAKHGTAVVVPGSDGAVTIADEGEPLQIVRRGRWLLLGPVGEPSAVPTPLADGPDISWTFDGPRLVEAANAADPAQRDNPVTTALQALVPRMAGHFDLGAVGITSTLTASSAAPWMIPVDIQALSRFPTGVMDVAAVGIDGPALWRTIGPAITATLATQAKDPQWHDPLSTIGVDTTWEQLVGGTTGTWALVMTPAIPALGYTLVIPRSPALDGVLEAVARAQGVTLPAEGQSGMIPLPQRVPVTLSVIRDHDRWLATTDPLIATTWLSGVPADGGWLAGPLGTLAKAKAAGGAGVLALSDTQAQLRTLAPMLGMGMSVIPGITPAEKQAGLLFLNRLARIATPGWNTVEHRDGGLVGNGEGLAGGSSNITLAPILAGMLLPAIGQTRQRARRAESHNNLRQLALATAVSVNDNARYPADLGALRKEMGDDLPPKVLHSPGDPTREGAYLYVRPAPTGDGNQPLLVEDPACWNGAGANVAFIDGHVDWLPRERAARVWTEAKRLAALPVAATTGITAREWAAVWQDLNPGKELPAARPAADAAPMP